MGCQLNGLGFKAPPNSDPQPAKPRLLDCRVDYNINNNIIIIVVVFVVIVITLTTDDERARE